ncbi:MAG TPA: trypsin-like peptidase domain-containing protein [Verrucomicrobiae bacterium]|nr:trypsin-like peptidase domain-containing protein [Verrucomicrobiae bacterium]
MRSVSNRLMICAAGLCLLLAQSVEVAASDELDIRRDATVEAVERVMPSVVNIATETIIQIRDPFEDLLRQFFNPYHSQQAPHSQLSLGSGVIIDEDGYVLTNDHVVRRADKIWVKLNNKSEPYEAKLIASNPKTDVALLKLKCKPGEHFAAVKFAQDDDLLLGETVLALGNPFGLGGSVSRGILSSKSRSAPKENDQLDVPNWLQTDASINPGNSGGPLVNLRGELIGLNVAILSKAQGIGFAIPIKLVNAALSEIVTPELSSKQLWFGARVKPVSLPLMVTTVESNSPADKAGLKPGDQIVRVNGHPPRGLIDFNQELVNSEKQDVVLAVKTGNESREITVHLVLEKDFFNAALIEKRIGVTLQKMDAQLAGYFGLDSANGFIVADVDAKSPAANNLQAGCLVSSIEGQTPPDMISAAKLVFTKKPGDTVQLSVLQPQKRGRFTFLVPGQVELPVQ